MVELIKKIGESLQKDASDILEKNIEERLKSFDADKKTVLAFKNALTDLSEKSQKPIVIFLDELDRCRPDFAVRTLERVKHFFNTKGVVFVLFINRLQLTESIKGCYGSGIDSDNYLNKFINFTVTLNQRKINYKNSKNESLNYIENIMKKYKRNNTHLKNDECFITNFANIVTRWRISFREIKQAVELYLLIDSIHSLTKMQKEYICWTIILKIKKTDYYNSIIWGDTQFLKKVHKEIENLIININSRDNSSNPPSDPILNAWYFFHHIESNPNEEFETDSKEFHMKFCEEISYPNSFKEYGFLKNINLDFFDELFQITNLVKINNE